MTHRILPLIACLLLLAQWSHADDSSLTIKDVIDTGEKAEAVIADSLQDDSIRPGDTPLSTMLAIMDAFEILNRIDSEEEELELASTSTKTETKVGFAERRSR